MWERHLCPEKPKILPTGPLLKKFVSKPDVCMCVSHCSHVQLCNPTDCSPPGPSVHGVLQARTLEWAAVPSSRGSSPPRDRTCVPYVSCIGRWVLHHECHLGSPTPWCSHANPMTHGLRHGALIRSSALGHVFCAHINFLDGHYFGPHVTNEKNYSGQKG